MASLVLVAELLTAVFQGKELSPGQYFPPLDFEGNRDRRAVTVDCDRNRWARLLKKSPYKLCTGLSN